MIKVWFPNLYGVKPVSTPQKTQEEEYEEELRKKKIREKKVFAEEEESADAFARNIINRYYRDQ